MENIYAIATIVACFVCMGSAVWLTRACRNWSAARCNEREALWKTFKSETQELRQRGGSRQDLKALRTRQATRFNAFLVRTQP